MSAGESSTSDFFEAKYRSNPDPWDFAGSSYERSRYSAIVAALVHRRYRRAFEPGCSVGVLTERLAGICDRVEAIDFAPAAVAGAKARCAHLPNVDVSCQSLQERMPVAGFDLIVLSEIGYYFDPASWGRLTLELIAPMASEATLLAAHWLGSSSDHCMSGDRVHEILDASELLHGECSQRHAAFRLDRWVRK